MTVSAAYSAFEADAYRSRNSRFSLKSDRDSIDGVLRPFDEGLETVNQVVFEK